MRPFVEAGSRWKDRLKLKLIRASVQLIWKRTFGAA
jgi:hypothetical protein